MLPLARGQILPSKCLRESLAFLTYNLLLLLLLNVSFETFS